MMNLLRRVLLALACANLVTTSALAQSGGKQSALPTATTITGSETVTGLQAGVNKNFALAQIQGLQTFPAGFGWDSVSHPVNVYRSPNGRYYTDLVPQSVPSIAPIFSRANQVAGGVAGGTQIVYADRSKADNSGSGNSPATAKQGLLQARQACESSAASYCLVYAAPGDYDRSANWNQSQTGNLPTKPTALVCAGGPSECIVSTTQKGLTWTCNAGVCTTTRANTTRVLNELTRDGFGDRSEFAYVLSAGAVGSCTTDCWFLDTGTNVLSIHRADGATPTDTNTRVLVLDGAVNLSPGVPFYMSGFTVMGGYSWTLGMAASGSPVSMDVVVVDSYIGYAGGYGGTSGYTFGGKNGVNLWDFNGLFYCLRCTVAKTTADGLNPHIQLSTQSHSDWLIVESDIHDIGRNGNLSNNCTTGHDGTSSSVPSAMIVLQTTCRGAAGGAVRHIGYSQVWLAGVTIDGDRGDDAFVSLSTGTNPTPFSSTCMSIENNGKMFAQDVRCVRNVVGISVAAGAAFAGRRVDYGGARLAGGGLNADGTVNAF